MNDTYFRMRFWSAIDRKWLSALEMSWMTVEENYTHPYMMLLKDEHSTDIHVTQSVDKDKNDKLIFVGDYIIHDDGTIFEICWDGEKILARQYIIDTKCYCEDCQSGKYNCYTYEDLSIYLAIGKNVRVIGNIFEDRDLYMRYGKEK